MSFCISDELYDSWGIWRTTPKICSVDSDAISVTSPTVIVRRDGVLKKLLCSNKYGIVLLKVYTKKNWIHFKLYLCN